MGKDILLYPIGFCGLVFIVNHKWINKIQRLEKVDDRISIVQLEPGTKNKTKIKPRCESKRWF